MLYKTHNRVFAGPFLCQIQAGVLLNSNGRAESCLTLHNAPVCCTPLLVLQSQSSAWQQQLLQQQVAVTTWARQQPQQQLQERL